MALIIRNPQGLGHALDASQKYWLYGANDTLGTRQAFDHLHPQLAGDDLMLYNCAVAFQWPCLAMGWRGIKIDERARAEAESRCVRDELAAIDYLNQHPTLKEKWDVMGPRPTGDVCTGDRGPRKAGKKVLPKSPSPARHLWQPRGGDPDIQVCKYCGGPRLVGQPFNPHSPDQTAHFLYVLMGFKRVYSRKSSTDSTHALTTNEEAIEKTAQRYPAHADLLDRILSAKKLRKQLGVLRARRSIDGRWRSSLNVCAAETGRMSSSKSAYSDGGNNQNVADDNRGIFVPDAGLEMFYADFEQAESKIVAHTSDCPQDIADHLSGNTHVGLARTLFSMGILRWDLEGADWADEATRSALPWKRTTDGEFPRGLVTLKQICEQPQPWKPEHDYYRAAKVTRHGINIAMSPSGLQRQLHCDLPEAKRLHAAYFERYPENEARQLELRTLVRAEGRITGPLGNTRTVLGRLWEDDTQRALLAQVQQSTVAWMLMLAFWRIWYEMDTRLHLGTTPRPSDPNRLWLLAPVHDAILGLRRPGDDDALRRVVQIMETPVIILGKPVVIKAEVAVGKSWLHDDLKVWKP